MKLHHSILITILSAVFYSSYGSAATFQKSTLWDHRNIRICFGSNAEDYKNGLQANQQKIGNYLAGVDQFIRSVIEKPLFTDSRQDIERMLTKVRKTVERELTPDSTGIYFIGWKQCPKDREAISKEYDAFLMITEVLDDKQMQIALSEAKKNHPYGFKIAGISFNESLLSASIPSGQSTIGNLKRQPEGENTVVSFIRLSKRDGKFATDDFNEQTILHEFGHLSGMRHEHERPETVNERDCPGEEIDQTPWSRRMLIEYHKKVITFPYDTTSIMNYCQNTRERRAGLEDQTSLSEGDRSALKLLYGKKRLLSKNL